MIIVIIIIIMHALGQFTQDVFFAKESFMLFVL
jgi:hypothetical protein